MKKSIRVILAVAVVTALCLSGVGTVGAQSDGAGSGTDRVVEDGEALFLYEEDINTNAGVFENLNPGQFTDADGRTLSLDNGAVDPSNSISTYTATDPGTGDRLSVDVREARIQRIRPINPRSGARLDFPGKPRVRPGENNLQFAVNYNYFESTEIDEELRQDGNDVTRIHLERSRDRAVTGSRTEAADGTSYDAVFTFSIDDTGDYEFVAEPLTGDERPDGRDVGFDDRDEVSGSYIVNVGFGETQDDEDGEEDGDGMDEDDGMEGDEDGDGEMDGNEDEDSMDEDDGMDGDEDGDGEMDGEEDGNVTDGEEEDGMNGEEGMDEDEDDMGGGEDGNVTDGMDGNGEEDSMDGEDDGMDGEEDGDATDGEEDEGDDDGSEGLPGFTVVTALLALATAIAVIVKREVGQ